MHSSKVMVKNALIIPGDGDHSNILQKELNKRCNFKLLFLLSGLPLQVNGKPVYIHNIKAYGGVVV
jgi:hypothetical protein